MSGPERITLAMTGASGAQYGLRLLDCLVQEEREVHFLISTAAQLVIATETDVALPPKPRAMQAVLTEYTGATSGQIRVFGQDDWMAPPASGSSAPAAMVVVPCSTGSLSAIASGACNNLIERAADVAGGRLVEVDLRTGPGQRFDVPAVAGDVARHVGEHGEGGDELRALLRVRRGKRQGEGQGEKGATDHDGCRA